MDYQRACGIHGGRSAYNSFRMQNRQMGISRQPAWQSTNESSDRTHEDCPMRYGLAIVTSPVQCWQNLFSPCEAFAAGTLFRELHLPFVGCHGSMNCHYHRNGGLQ